MLVIFLAFLVIGVVFGGILGAVAGAAGSEDETADAIVSFVSNTALTAVTTPLFAAIVTVLYFDQRVRKEGFDLQLLAEGMGEQPAFTGAPQPQPQPPQQAQPPAQPAPGGTSGWQPPSSSPPPPGSPGDPRAAAASRSPSPAHCAGSRCSPARPPARRSLPRPRPPIPAATPPRPARRPGASSPAAATGHQRRGPFRGLLERLGRQIDRLGDIIPSIDARCRAGGS